MQGWLLVLLMTALLAASIFAATCGIYFAWLSVFPERQSQFQVLEIKVWVSWAVAAILLIADAWLVVHVIRRIRRRDRITAATRG